MRPKSARRGDEPRPGYLVINPLNVPRRAAVILPDAALDLRPEGPLRAAQFTERGVSGRSSTCPPSASRGFPARPTRAVRRRSPAGLSARGRQLRNESIEIEIDAATGGIRSLAAVGEPTARLGQQLVIDGIARRSRANPLASQMRCERFDVDYGGPALVQATSTGSLVDPRQGNRLASFVAAVPALGRPADPRDRDHAGRSRSRLARASGPGRSLVGLPGMPLGLARPNSMLRRTVFWSPELTEAERPETPDVFDISTRTQRTALLFGGLPYHRKHGSRMLDTLLVAGHGIDPIVHAGGRARPRASVPCRPGPDHAGLRRPDRDGPPAIGPTGWLAQVDRKIVAVSHVEFVEKTGDDRGWGLVFHLLETSGQAARCRLRLFRNPTWARQVDFLGETIIDLSIEGDAVQIDLTPHELARVEVTMGTPRAPVFPVSP